MRYIISILVSVSFVFAARPFMTDDYGVVGDNVVEVELGHDYISDGSLESYIALKHGLSPKSEIDIALSYGYPGLSPLNASLKLQIVDLGPLHYTLNFSGDWGYNGFDINNIVSFEKGRLLLNLNVSLLSSLSSVEFGLSPVYEIMNGLSLGGDIRYRPDNGAMGTLFGLSYELVPFVMDIGAGYENGVNNFYVTSGIVLDL